MVSLKQPAFSGGIISPQALGRTDQNKYATGLRTLANAWITRYGTVENRPGQFYCATVKDSTAKVREVPFIFSTSLSYLLEFGNNYLRVLKQGARISVVGAATYDGAATYGIGDLVTFTGTVYWSKVASNSGHTPDVSPTQWYAQVGGLLEIPTNIPQASLATFQYVQQNDVMTIADQAIIPQQLQRYSDTKWSYLPFTQSTGIAAPGNPAAVAGNPASSTPAAPGSPAASGGFSGSAGQDSDTYAISSWDLSSEGVPTVDFISPGTRMQATNADPITLTWNNVVAASGYGIYKRSGASGGTFGLIAIIPAATHTYVDHGDIASPIAVRPTDATGSKTWTYEVTAISSTTGAESLASAQVSCHGKAPTNSANANTISWDAVVGASKYNIYRVVNGVPGFIGSQPASPFKDQNIIPDTSIQPPVAIALFSTSNDYPAVVGFYQQRLGFANTVNQPQTAWLSKVGVYSNFTTSTPVADDDAVSFTIVGREVQPIRALVDLGKLIIHTANAEYVASGNQFGTITPTAISLTATGSAGAAALAPVVIGNTDLFVQAGATRLLDLRYSVQRFSFDGKDLTKYAPDLFRGRTIVDMAWQKLPHSIVWCVLDNGVLLGLTYVAEDELWSWHLHSSTNGAYENVAVVPEGSQFVVYVVVRRTIGGVTKRMIERLAPRDLIDTVLLSDATFADAALTYDGRNTGSTTMTVTTTAAWTPSDLLTITASAGTFTAGDVGNHIVLQKLDPLTGLVSDQVTFQITGYTSTTAVTALPLRNVPTWAQAVALTTWGKAVASFSGISHLEGQSLSVIADGDTAADPGDSAYPLVTVASGAFTLAKPALVVTAGLSIQWDVQTLPVESATGETIANKRITVNEACPIFHNARSALFGQDNAHLKPWRAQKASTFGLPVAPFTGPFRIPIQGTPQDTGQVWIRGTAPLPFGMSAIVVTGEVSN